MPKDTKTDTQVTASNSFRLAQTGSVLASTFSTSYPESSTNTLLTLDPKPPRGISRKNKRFLPATALKSSSWRGASHFSFNRALKNNSKYGACLPLSWSPLWKQVQTDHSIYFLIRSRKRTKFFSQTNYTIQSLRKYLTLLLFVEKACGKAQQYRSSVKWIQKDCCPHSTQQYLLIGILNTCSLKERTEGTC